MPRKRPRDRRGISTGRDMSMGQTGHTPRVVPPRFFMCLLFFLPRSNDSKIRISCVQRSQRLPLLLQVWTAGENHNHEGTKQSDINFSAELFLTFLCSRYCQKNNSPDCYLNRCHCSQERGPRPFFNHDCDMSLAPCNVHKQPLTALEL